MSIVTPTSVKPSGCGQPDSSSLAPDAPRGALRARRRQQAGQSVLIVLGVLFLVAFLGALFVLVVIRNLENAQRQNQVLTADDYAQAGINYANSMLQNSPLGADWRPTLQYAVATPSDVPGYVATSPTDAALPTTPINDPDFRWLSDGYTRYNLANGRFLLRVTYNPAAATLNASGTSPSPNAKYLKIEVVGRQGVVDSSDPTTYTNSPSESLRAERVAYKPIGLVDYARFITNKDNQSETATLGVPSNYDATNGITTPGVMDISNVVPGAGSTTLTLTPYPITTTFGSVNAYANTAATPTTYAGGGSLRCNANLRIYGNNQLYLDGQFGDDWEIDGNLTFDQYTVGTAATAQATQAILIGTTYSGTTYPAPGGQTVYPANDATNYSTIGTVGGLIRDGNPGNDTQGYPRSVGRLNPPVIDSTDPVSNLTRYQVLTKPTVANSFIGQATPGTANALATVYINNSGDIQTETVSAGNPSTLREEWLRTSATAQHWEGNFYNPPGVTVAFGQITDATFPTGQTFWGMTLTRSDTDALGNAVKWPGTNSSTVEVAYAQQPAGFTFNADAPVVFLSTSGTPVSDIVVYADGNVRVHGVISNPNTTGGTVTAQHVTIATNGIAYVEGSILRGVEASAPTVVPGQAGASVALLARQYACLNTTQFLAGTANFTGANQPSSSDTDDFLDFRQGDTLTFNPLLPIVYQDQGTYGGVTRVYIDGTGHYAEHLYLSEQAADSATSVANATATGDFQIVTATPPTVTGSFTPAAQADSPTRTTYLFPSVAPNATLTAANDNIPFALTFNTDSMSPTDWMLERAAVLPADVKIEAVLYAENNSFFVIPGDWFNTDTSDVLNANYVQRPPNVADPLFPLHGQPIDMQITIDGSVTENMPADIADQAAWMQKWGWIPRYHGTKFGSDGTIANGADISPHVYEMSPTAIPTKIGVGLSFVYDPLNGFPVVNPGALPSASNMMMYTAPTFVRTDVYGRALPSVPALPVSPDLLYNGQPTS